MMDTNNQANSPAKVDIIIPAFNAARYLPFALASVESQTFSDWHILLVDDGSTDNTLEVVTPFVERFGSRMTYLKQENRGLPAARNTAIRHSTAEFLALLDADDIWLPCRLEESIRCFEEHPDFGLVYGLIDRVDTSGKLIDSFAGNTGKVEGRIAREIYMRTVELPCPTITFRRECIDRVGVFDETLNATEDRDLWLRIATNYSIGFTPKVIAQYRMSSASMSADPDRMLNAQRRFLAKHAGIDGMSDRERSFAMGRIFKQSAEAYVARKQPWKALTKCARALWSSPFDRANLRTFFSVVMQCTGLRT